MSQELENIKSSKSLGLRNKPNELLGDWIKNEADRQIADTYSYKLISDYDHKDMEGIVEVMSQWRLLLGVTNEVTYEELRFITQFVYDNFKGFSLSDLKLAMNYAISGKIDIGYFSFKTMSAWYVSRVLKEYAELKRENVNRIYEDKEKYMKKIEPKVLSPIEKANNFKDYIISLYKSTIEGGVFYDVGDIAYNWLKKTNILIKSQVLIHDALEYGKQRVIEERKEDTLKQAVTNVIEEDKKSNKINKYAREYLIQNTFQNITIGQIIEKINPNQFE